MEVVTPNSSHTLTIYSRENIGDAVAIVYNEQTNDNEKKPITTTYNEGKLTFTLDYEMTEGNNYFVIINNQSESEEIAKFKIFCTSATDLQRYALSDGKYTYAPKSGNKFVTV